LVEATTGKLTDMRAERQLGVDYGTKVANQTILDYRSAALAPASCTPHKVSRGTVDFEAVKRHPTGDCIHIDEQSTFSTDYFMWCDRKGNSVSSA